MSTLGRFDIHTQGLGTKRNERKISREINMHECNEELTRALSSHEYSMRWLPPDWRRSKKDLKQVWYKSERRNNLSSSYCSLVERIRIQVLLERYMYMYIVHIQILLYWVGLLVHGISSRGTPLSHFWYTRIVSSLGPNIMYQYPLVMLCSHCSRALRCLLVSCIIRDSFRWNWPERRSVKCLHPA